jgi:hypothetical protein
MPEAPHELLARAAAWEDMSRWERAEIGRALRRLGWSYGEIREMIPVPKGTLAGWCRDIRLTADQVAALAARTGERRSLPRDTQWRRREEVERIRKAARAEVADLITDPLWLAGTVMYWAEGEKRSRHLTLTNTDPAALRLFIAWVRRFLMPDPTFVLSLHLHSGNHEATAMSHWRRVLALPTVEFWKTYWKPPGTGHRTNRHKHGVCRVFARRGTDAWIRASEWIAVLQDKGWRD